MKQQLADLRDHFGKSGSCLSLLTYTRWWNSLITLPRPSNFILRVSCLKQSRKGGGLVRFIECVHESYSKTKPCGKVRAAEEGLGNCWNLALIYSFKDKTRGKKWSSRRQRTRTAMVDCSEHASLRNTYFHGNLVWPYRFHALFVLLPIFQ